ncbi:carbamoyltransferase HypF [Lacrimispora aerotolerans]|uniref:carbamoyltransferase HypF n=1 Tax=Lacrimispora aerotolerans TaxID=36832 RepID=UPI00068BED67|nr:carbamoyltransferase HypF [Lacrimispora aerotolerans]
MDQGKDQSMTLKIYAYGIVQGVGFRPLVYHMAKNEGISGSVRNVGGYVEIIAQGEKGAVGRFLTVLTETKDMGYEIIKLEKEEISSLTLNDFVILKSGVLGESSVIPPDLPVCPACRKELLNPGNRRYGNPFISCISCGPRYTIMERLPYDRDHTAMIDFKMCEECEKEYTSPESRRFHAQTISCNDCGPYLIYRDKKKEEKEWQEGEALDQAAAALLEGGIIAVKGIGGYHLVCSPFREDTVNRLRILKGREEKPFAVMFSSIAEIKKYCHVSKEERSLLESRPRPIVLLRREGDYMAPSTNKGSMYCGAFLPYTPLQILLTGRLGPLIMTSANISGQPIIREDEPMLSLSSKELRGVLYHHRRILRSVDDSVAKIVAGKPQLIRRSRGYVPYPVFLSEEVKENHGEKEPSVFAAGGDLKASFCFYENGSAVVSQYFGDLEESKVMEEYESSFEDMKELFRFQPELVVCDLHPNYHSARYASTLGLPLIKVQHHHAHIASVMAEHHLDGPVIGVAMDGTGYGTDGTIWGGEFLICQDKECKRAGHISPFPILGGDQSMREAWKTAICCLTHFGLQEYITDERSDLIKAALHHHVNVVSSSSAGRLFDAASSVLLIAHENTYEGECASLFEKSGLSAISRQIRPASVPFEVSERNGIWELDPKSAFTALCKERGNGNVSALALGFHIGFAKGIVSICQKLKDQYGISDVCLSGGVFQNTVLTEHTAGFLREKGFKVYMNLSVPPNDGGISLGQVYLGRKYLKAFHQTK